MVAAKPIWFHAEIAFTHQRVFEDLKIFGDVDDIAGEMISGQLSGLLLAHQKGRDGSAHRNDTTHRFDASSAQSIAEFLEGKPMNGRVLLVDKFPG